MIRSDEVEELRREEAAYFSARRAAGRSIDARVLAFIRLRGVNSEEAPARGARLHNITRGAGGNSLTQDG